HLVDALKSAFQVPYTAQKIIYGVIKDAGKADIVLGGELDFVLKLPSGELVICDSKSSADFPFKRNDLPKEEHVAQINLYLHSDFARANK
ncbi:MAG: hypothetical protein V4440_08760, partial [Pseudomonadota bacterium]